MKSIALYLRTIAAAIVHYLNQVVWPQEEQENPVPPIRYDGDPKDIYLA